MEQVKVVRKSPYQGVSQWGISTSSETTPDKKTAEKWAQLENAARIKLDCCGGVIDTARHTGRECHCEKS